MLFPIRSSRKKKHHALSPCDAEITLKFHPSITDFSSLIGQIPCGVRWKPWRGFASAAQITKTRRIVYQQHIKHMASLRRIAQLIHDRGKKKYIESSDTHGRIFGAFINREAEHEVDAPKPDESEQEPAP